MQTWLRLVRQLKKGAEMLSYPRKRSQLAQNVHALTPAQTFCPISDLQTSKRAQFSSRKGAN